jgi:hypothetical protein
VRGILLLGVLAVVGVAGAVFFLTSGDDAPAGPPHFSIFDRPAEPRDRAPQDEPASAIRTEEQTGEVRQAGTFRGYRFYLGKTGRGMCHFIVAPDGATGSGCASRTRAFSSGSTFGEGMAIAFVAVPDGYDEAKIVKGEVVDDRLMTNGYAAAFRESPFTVRFEGPRGERTVELRGWP